jgi:hypothetical protein
MSQLNLSLNQLEPSSVLNSLFLLKLHPQEPTINQTPVQCDLPSFSYKLLSTANLSTQTLQCKCTPNEKLQSYLVLLPMVLYWSRYHHVATL